MAYITKLTSKGQLTLPKEIRKALALGKGSYLAIDEVGEYVLMKKLDTKLDEITEVFQAEAKRKGITKEELIETLNDIQRKKWQ